MPAGNPAGYAELGFDLPDEDYEGLHIQEEESADGTPGEESIVSLEDLLDPEVGQPGIGSIGPTAAQEYADSGTEQLIEIVQNAQRNLNALASEQGEALKKAGQTAADLIRERGAREIASHRQRLKIGTALGTNLDDPTEQVTQLAAELLERQAGIRDRIKNIETKSATPVFDQPITALKALITLPADKAALKNDLDMYEVIRDQLNDINQATVQGVAAQNALAPSVTAAEITAATEATLAENSVKALELKRQAIAQGVQFEGTLASALARRAQAGTKIATENAKKQEKAAQDQQLINEFKQGYQVVYNQEPTLDDAQILSFLRKDSKGVPLNPQAAKLRDIGVNTLVSGNRRIGGTPFETLSTLKEFGAIETIPENLRPVVNLISRANARVESSAEARALVANPKEQFAYVSKITDEQTYREVDRDSRAIAASDASNIYQAYAPSAILQAAPALKNRPLISKLLQTRFAAGANVSDPELMIKDAASAVAKGEINATDAAKDIVAYFSVAVQLNNRERGYIGLGIPPQKAYPAALRIQGFDRIIEMTDPAQVARGIAIANTRTVLGGNALTIGAP